MKQISVRDLRQQASKWLRETQAGEIFEITDRGRPVARLTPLPSPKTLEELEAAGLLSKPKGDWHDLGPPLPLAPGEEPLSKVLERMRADERF